MPLQASGSPLAGGMSPANTMANETPKTVKVRVLRAFQVKEKLYKADTTVELERRFAIEMKTANKVEFITEAETRSDPSTQSASKAGKASKES